MQITRRLYGSIVFLNFIALPGLGDRALSPDPRLQTGKLRNGTTWIYRQHDTPEGRMALTMHVRAGSLNETDQQRGLAHFIEHMVFNGTEHFPPGKLVPYFESIGMKFGPDLNANTSFDRTAYKLILPEATPEQIEKGLTVLSNFAFRASFLADEIDKERPIILEEARSRKTAALRVKEMLWPKLFPGTRFAERMPIGTEKVIQTALREDFLAYYRTWYRPENVTVILVGDCTRVEGKLVAKKVNRIPGCPLGTKQLFITLPLTFGMPSPMLDPKDAVLFVYNSVIKAAKQVLNRA